MAHLSVVSRMECPVSCVILLILCSTILPAAVGTEVVGGSVVGVVGGDLVLPCSLKPKISAVPMEVTWYRGTDVVHLYRERRDELGQQHPDYRNRTSLFKEELQRGNASLKISSLRPSDIDTYKCEIQGQSGHIGTQNVQVEAVGSTPVITPESLRNGSVDLTCESTGWTYEPQVEWRDSRGQSLSAEPTTSQKFPEGYRVVRRVRVEKSDGTSFTCTVWTQRQNKEEEVKVDEELFIPAGLSAWAIVGIVFGFIAAIIIICFLTPWRRLWHWGNSVVWRHKIPKDLDVCMTTPRSAQLTWRRLPSSQPAHTFQVTYQRDGADPVILPHESLSITHPDNPELCRAEINDLMPSSRYVFKVCAVMDGQQYPSSSVCIRTALNGQQGMEMEPHQDRGERQPLNLQP